MLSYQVERERTLLSSMRIKYKNNVKGKYLGVFWVTGMWVGGVGWNEASK